MVNKRGKCVIIQGTDFKTKLTFVSALPVGILRCDRTRGFLRDTVANGLCSADNCLSFV